MKTLQITSLLAAVALSAACHHKRPMTHERVASIDKDTRDGAREMEKDIERDTKEAANGATKAGDDLDAALEGKHDVVGSAADDANAAANDAAKDVSTEAKKDTATVDAAADKANTDANAAAKDATNTAKTSMDKVADKADAVAKKTEPKKVVAEIETIDRHSKQVTFRIRDEEKDIQLQAGREMKIDFAELPVLTGMKIDAAISKMHEGQDVDLKVLGSGENAKVVKLTLGDF